MFNVKTIEEAYEIIKGINLDLQSIKVKTEDSLGYVISKDIQSIEDVPAFNKSTVDGYACKYEDILLASEQSPSFLEVVGKVEMGTVSNQVLKEGQAIYVPTGGSVPEGADCMVMIEHTDILQNQVLIYKKSSKYNNIVLIGQDIQKDTPFIKKYTKVTSSVIGALFSQNVKEIEVFKPFDFTVISTGDEITGNDVILHGEVRDINTHTVSSYIKERRHNVVHKVIIQDDFNQYKDEVIKGFESSDIVITSGGSSVGDKDYTINVLEDIGADVLLHGLSIKPGKPTILATYKGKLFIGLPGHPLSSYVVMHFIVGEILRHIYNQQLYKHYIELPLSENVHNNSGRMLVQLVKIENNQAIPLYYKSAMINVMQSAYGYILIDKNSEGLYKGDTVKIYRLGD